MLKYWSSIFCDYVQDTIAGCVVVFLTFFTLPLGFHLDAVTRIMYCKRWENADVKYVKYNTTQASQRRTAPASH